MKRGEKIFLYISVIVGIATISFIVNDSSKKEKEDHNAEEISEQIEEETYEYPTYLYKDKNDCYHKSLDCFHLNSQKSEGYILFDYIYTTGEANYAIQRELIFDLTNEEIVWTCSGCISDEDYAIIMEMTEPYARYNVKFENVSGWGE